MAVITLNRNKLAQNYFQLDHLFKSNGIEWAPVIKVLCGNRLFIEEVIRLGAEEVCDSRVSNLRTVRNLSSAIKTVYIKPPPKKSIKSIVRLADTSFNTEFETIRMLSEEAQKIGKLHKILIMIELGELREGVMGEDFVDFYAKVFRLPNIEVVGIGTNLACMYGVLPNNDKLIQLALYVQLIEAKFNRKIPYISAGTSVTIPLIGMGMLPKAINHFRVGETLFLGTDVYNNRLFENMNSDVFKLSAEIIEISEKPKMPMGELGYNMSGEIKEFDLSKGYESSQRAIIDIGLLDIETDHLNPIDKGLKIVGASSDMLVIDLDKNEQNYKVGDYIGFRLDYMGLLRVMNSNYIEKRVE